jgi:hypothetical protein
VLDAPIDKRAPEGYQQSGGQESRQEGNPAYGGFSSDVQVEDAHHQEHREHPNQHDTEDAAAYGAGRAVHPPE